MQIPNFPDTVFRLTLWPGKNGAGPVATFVRVPARYNAKTVATANSRRIALEKLGKIETIAESDTTVIFRTYVQHEEDVSSTFETMHHKMLARVQKKQEDTAMLFLNVINPHVIVEAKYES